MRKNVIDIITLGCSKNLVDSENLMGKLEAMGYHCTHDSECPDGEIAVINTCGFINDAKEESINTILEFAQRKTQGQLGKLFVMGCLSQRYREELKKEIPEVDCFYGKFDFKQLIKDIGSVGEETGCCKRRHITTPPHYAYIKIAEGCDRHCAYCAIPLITGRHVSRKEEDILDEVRMLVAQGVKEFQVIEQELTYYGVDIDGKRHIAQLISKMAAIPGVEWIRLHYAYPNQFPMELLDVIRDNDNVCNYLDIALQHISDNVLSRMRRNVTRQETIELIKTIRKKVPGICLRTTLLIGFPGETEEEFKELMEFVRWARFDRMGAFTYSEEDGTLSAMEYDDNIDDETKQSRLSRLMRLQQDISAEIEAEKVGKIMKVIIDRKEGEYYIGRTEFSSPEVESEVIIPVNEHEIKSGCFYNVKITGAEEFDVYGSVVK